MQLQYRISTALGTAALVMQMMAPAAFAADTDIVISGNGNNSTNNVLVKSNCTSNVSQVNTMWVGLTINSTASTGKNHANGNNGGGDVDVQSGNANSTVNINVSGGSNNATAPSCCDCVGNLSVNLTNNGNNSDNNANATSNQNKTVNQTGNLSVTGAVNSRARTGRNRANNNNGAGNKTVKSGNATSNVSANVTGPSNILNP